MNKIDSLLDHLITIYLKTQPISLFSKKNTYTPGNGMHALQLEKVPQHLCLTKSE